MMYNYFQNIKLLLCVLITISCSSFNLYAHKRDQSQQYKKIADFDKILLIISNKPFKPVDGTLFVDGLKGNGLHFQKEILKRTDIEIANDKAKAIDFFAERFGIDITDQRVFFTGFEIAADERARVISSEKVPERGWKVHDGGWSVTIIDKNGIDLGGEFVNTHVPQGSFFSYGNYLIDKHDNATLINYRSKIPSLPGVNGAFQIINEVSSLEYGKGQVIGGAYPIRLPDGKIIFNARGVFTFPPLGNYKRACKTGGCAFSK